MGGREGRYEGGRDGERGERRRKGGREDTRKGGKEGREEEERREGGERGGGGRERGERRRKGGRGERRRRKGGGWTEKGKGVAHIHLNKSKKRRDKLRGGKRGEEGTLHKLSQVSRLHCLQQVLWPRGEVRDNCTQVVMATRSLSTEQEVLLSWEGVREEGGGERVSKDMKVSGYEGYEGVCNSIWVYERGREMTRRRVCVKSCSHVYTTISCVCVRL